MNKRKEIAVPHNGWLFYLCVDLARSSFVKLDRTEKVAEIQKF